VVATKNDMTNRTIAGAQPFNEPDFGPWNQGSPQNLSDIRDGESWDSAA
jgi:hypothetical protein